MHDIQYTLNAESVAVAFWGHGSRRHLDRCNSAPLATFPKEGSWISESRKWRKINRSPILTSHVLICIEDTVQAVKQQTPFLGPENVCFVQVEAVGPLGYWLLTVQARWVSREPSRQAREATKWRSLLESNTFQEKAHPSKEWTHQSTFASMLDIFHIWETKLNC